MNATFSLYINITEDIALLKVNNEPQGVLTALGDSLAIIYESAPATNLKAFLSEEPEDIFRVFYTTMKFQAMMNKEIVRNNLRELAAKLESTNGTDKFEYSISRTDFETYNNELEEVLTLNSDIKII